MEALVEASDTLFITTPDSEITTVWGTLASYKINHKLICHFSGSLSSDVFSGIASTKAFCCSIHPMYPFSNKFTSYQKLNTAFLTMEGDTYALSTMVDFWENLGHKVFILDKKDKITYHTAAVIASNCMVGLMKTSVDLLGICGFKEEDGLQLLKPLILQNITAILEHGCRDALTGPIERNDFETISKHLQALSNKKALDLYRLLSIQLVALASEKNAERNYTLLTHLLTKQDSDSIDSTLDL